MKTLAAVLGVCLSIAIAQPSLAATVTYTLSPPENSVILSDDIGFIRGFNPDLGTLTSVTLDADWSFTGHGGLLGPGAMPVERTWNPVMEIGTAATGGLIGPEFPPSLKSIALTIEGNGFLEPTPDPITGNLSYDTVLGHASENLNLSDPKSLSFFSSTPDILAAGLFYDGVIYFGRFAQSQPSLSLAYNYTPASTVPEPATWAMMALGVGFVGWSARRRLKADLPKGVGLFA